MNKIFLKMIYQKKVLFTTISAIYICLKSKHSHPYVQLKISLCCCSRNIHIYYFQFSMFALIFSINRLHLFLWIQMFFSALSCQPSRVDIRWCLLNAARVYVANTVQKQSWLWFSFVFFSFFLTIHSNPKKFWVSSLQFSGLPLHHVSWYFSFPLFFLFCHWSCKTQWIFHKRTLPSLKEKKKETVLPQVSTDFGEKSSSH